MSLFLSRARTLMEIALITLVMVIERWLYTSQEERTCKNANNYLDVEWST